MITQDCRRCGTAYEVDIDLSNVTEESFQALADAREAHDDSHAPPAVTHIRRRVNPRRVRGSQFYKLRLSESENGSETLCGAPNTYADMGWGEARYPKNLAYVSCETCKGLR